MQSKVWSLTRSRLSVGVWCQDESVSYRVMVRAATCAVSLLRPADLREPSACGQRCEPSGNRLYGFSKDELPFSVWMLSTMDFSRINPEISWDKQ
ncbi:hypothetical protein RRG08_016255 [Elysia crispata]|uniref:Uncharacterized protein n=1 Tax=Elysia crispata TaxID=231223 RepID=A0AAE1ALW2_9GAST|nr:hypothetical protein RRG08_016255 [Elysia crispata]